MKPNRDFSLNIIKLDRSGIRMKNFVLISLLLLLTNSVTYWFSREISGFLTPNVVPIISEIQLKTNCDLMNKSFIIRDLDTGKGVVFNLSKAYLQTVEGNSLQIQMNPTFSDVTSDFEVHKATKKMEIELDCNISNKLKDTLNSLRNTFKN